ncbi:MFS transporter [Actinomadura namibiensis]|uniref:MFS family permease n=1 Tax=Actinomadura namibiensis TaxID=182080 RepID=A0A7W3QLQ0_ACTNM|nr:MFS transporter [Actinomadura namibiensis]MBA8951656.1 MFS family permease [Actinomadura namibiensis]
MKGRRAPGGSLDGRGRALLLLTAVELVVFLDTTVLNVALPAIGRDLRLDEAGLGWVTNAYLLAFGGFMLLGGRAADLLGPRRVFAWGLAVFTVASALAGLAGTAWLLVAARALQGIGAAVVVPAQLALLTATFTSPEARRRAFGVWSAMGAAGAAVGTAAGGPLTDGFGWPSIFLINVPVGVVALAFLPRLLPADPRPDAAGAARAAGTAARPAGGAEVPPTPGPPPSAPGRAATAAAPPRDPAVGRPARGPGRLDVPGAVTGTAALLLLGYAIGALGDPGARAVAWPCLAAGAGLLAAFLVIEARSPHPLMPLRLFAVRAVSGSAAVNALVGAAHVPAFALLALYLQNSQGYGPTRSGLAVLPVAAVNIVVSRTLIPYALKRLGATGVLAAGMALQAAAMAWFARLPLDGSYVVDVLPAALVFGVGLPAAFVGVTVPAVTAVDKDDTGIAAGIVNTVQRVGSGLGVTALLLLAAEVGGSTPEAYIDGIHAGFAAAAALAALGCLLTLSLLRPGPGRAS